MTAFHPFQAGYTFWSFVQTVQTLIRRRHRRRKVLNIWGGGGGQGFEYWGRGEARGAKLFRWLAVN